MIIIKLYKVIATYIIVIKRKQTFTFFDLTTTTTTEKEEMPCKMWKRRSRDRDKGEREREGTMKVAPPGPCTPKKIVESLVTRFGALCEENYMHKDLNVL